MFTDENNKRNGFNISQRENINYPPTNVIIPESGVQIVIATSALDTSYRFTPDYQLRSYKQH